MTQPQGRILVVDDELDLLDILGDFLQEQGYGVAMAVDGLRALELLREDSGFDLVLSDINMPRMKGFELIHNIRLEYPRIKTALLTAYDVNSYIELAKKYDIGNIIAKTSPFNFNDLRINVRRWITGDIFGLEKCFDPGVQKQTQVITHSNQIERLVQNIFELHQKQPRIDRVKTALREVVVNAVFYGARQEDGSKKDDWVLDVALEPSEHVSVDYASDEGKLGIAIIDQKGRLKKSDVLYWLERNTVRDSKTGFIKSLDDEHGRGLFISREFIDTLVINVDPGKKTEVILLNYFKGNYKGYKPLIINEL
jgi:CheY-like chemotaxis protein